MDRNDVAIKSPCTLDWRKMSPTEGGRFCVDCKQVVRDLSMMTEREARALVRSRGEGKLCVRYMVDRHGAIVFAPERPPIGYVAPSMLNRAKRAALAAAALVTPFAAAACDVVDPGHEEWMGDIAAPVDSPPPTSEPRNSEKVPASDASAVDAAADAADAAVDAGPAPDAAPDPETDAGPDTDADAGGFTPS